MSACSWILTWFSHTKGKADSKYIFRIWDYLICSDSSSLVFLVTSVLLYLFPADADLSSDNLMEAMQEAKDSFEFAGDNTEDIIAEAERMRYKFCCKVAWVEEYNGLLLKDSKYAIRPLGMMRLWSGLQKRPIIYTVISLVVVMALVSYLSSPTSKRWIEVVAGPLISAATKAKELVYLLVRK